MSPQPAYSQFASLEVAYPQPAAHTPGVPAELAPAVRELAASFEKIEFALRRLMALR